MWKKFLIGGLQMFWMDFSFPQDRHEIGVSRPSGNDVAMNMFIIPGSSSFTDIVANVKALRVDHGPKYFNRPTCQVIHFLDFLGILRGQAPYMSEGRHHYVSGIIGEDIHDYKSRLASMKNIIFGVIICFW
jgi:hypothetical protein